MRMTKIMAALVAAFASLALAVTMAPANAEQEVTSSRAGFVSFKTFVNDAQTAWVSKGKAITWKRKAVQIQRKPVNGGSWRTVKTVRTNRFSGFRTTLRPGRHIPCNGTHFKTRAKKKGKPQYKVAAGEIWCS